MFLSVKERARQIAMGQFTAPTNSAPVASLIDLAPEPKPVAVALPRKTNDAPQKVVAESKKKTKGAPAKESKESISKVAPGQKSQSKTTPPAKTTPVPASKPTPSKPTLSKTLSKTAPAPPEVSSPKKSSSSKSKLSKENPSRPSPIKTASSKSLPPSSSKPTTPKVPPSPKPTTTQKSKSKPSASSPPKRVDSPLLSSASSTTSDDDTDPLTTLKTACLKQISAVPGLGGGRQLAVVLKQRSSGEWYAALKDTGSDKYLKAWMKRDKTFKTRREALEAYLVFATKMRNGVSWLPLSPRAGSPPRGKTKR